MFLVALPSLRQLPPQCGFSAAGASPLKTVEIKDFSGWAVDPTVGGFELISLSSRRFLRRQCTLPIWFTRTFSFYPNTLLKLADCLVSKAFRMAEGFPTRTVYPAATPMIWMRPPGGIAIGRDGCADDHSKENAARPQEKKLSYRHPRTLRRHDVLD
jgi:hypothetical protein